MTTNITDSCGSAFGTRTIRQIDTWVPLMAWKALCGPGHQSGESGPAAERGHRFAERGA